MVWGFVYSKTSCEYVNIVHSKILVRNVFPQVALKDIFATLKFRN